MIPWHIEPASHPKMDQMVDPKIFPIPPVTFKATNISLVPVHPVPSLQLEKCQHRNLNGQVRFSRAKILGVVTAVWILEAIQLAATGQRSEQMAIS
jgi:hypothetical protein